MYIHTEIYYIHIYIYIYIYILFFFIIYIYNTSYNIKKKKNKRANSYNNYKIVLITRYLKIKNKLKKKIQKCICTNILYLLHSHIYVKCSNIYSYQKLFILRK
ncbi:hypothetical protein PFAG_04151 [Plasmodium falciparum Santa Lucia]|uniref:Uncharacterized protein n=1 Tax=Plasmodium falciparum Santa Lucia TaxID=478859 RepID=W7FEF3_PLAFA|nr:hypothetical protein PFAG_04151 [Plasmodium falciparum Santa Lucia]